MSLGKLVLNLGVNTGTFITDMGRAARVSAKRSKQIREQMTVAMKAVGAGALAAAGSLGTMVQKTANTADQVQKMSNRLGVSTEFLSQYRHVAELSGTTLDRVGDGVRKMSKSINDGNNGLSTATRAFESLGISLDELNSLSPEQQFELIADRISKVEDQSVKAGAAMDIFGRAGVDLLTILNEGSEGIKEMREEADAFGLTISQQGADAAATFNDEITRLKNKFTGLTETIGQGLIPVASEMIRQFNSPGISTGTDMIGTMQQTMITLYGAVLFVGDGFEVVGNAVGAFAVKGIQAFDLVSTSLDVFVTRFKRGAKIIASAWSDEAALAESELGKEIDKMEARVGELYDAFMSPELADSFVDDAKDVFAETLQRIDQLNAVASKTGTKLKNGVEKPLDAAGAAAGEAGDNIERLNEKLDGLGDKSGPSAAETLSDYQSILQEFETPLERLNRIYDEQIDVIGRYMKTVSEGSDEWKQAGELINKLTDRLIEQEEAIESALTPYEQLIRSLEEEAAMLGMTEAQLIDLEARRLLEQAGIVESAKNIDEYNAKLAETVALLSKTQGVELPGGKLGAFGGVFESILGNIGGELKDTVKGIGSAFMNMFNQNPNGENAGMFRGVGMAATGIGAFMNAMDQGLDVGGGLLRAGQSVLAMIPGWGQAVAAAMEVVNQIAGGKLFGTAFKVKKSTRTLGIGAGGASGGVSTLETRQRSFFRGTARRTTETDLDSDTLSALNELFESVGMALQHAAAAVGGQAGELISGSFVEEFDKDGNLVSQSSEVMGRTFNESFDQFAQRLTAENLLAGIGTIFAEVGQIAERWRGNASTLLEGAQMLLQAGVDINAGNGLFSTLDQVTDAIESMVKPGETLAEAYQRVQGSVLMLDDALNVMGQTLEMARLDYVEFAAGITEAAGGIEAAQSLWASYFQTFYTEQELAANALANATNNRDELLSSIGLDSDIGVQQFRELFESQLPTLSAEAVVEWLRAADAIGVVVGLEAELNEQREENAAQLAAMMNAVASEIEDMGLSPFALRLKEVRLAFDQQIKAARELGATERELAMIQTYATRQIQQAIMALENDISAGLTDLYGTELDRINEQISLLEQQQGQISSVGQASANRYEQELRAIQNIQGFLDDLFLDENLSPLNAFEQLGLAQSQFDEMLALAQGGDIDALNALPGLAQTLLSLGQDVFASSDDYVAIFDSVTGALADLGVTSTPQSDPQQTIIGQNSEMIALLAERNRLEEEFDSNARLNAALAIADQIAELVSVTGESFTSLAERLGIPVEEFLADLGVSLDELTVETATALGETAARLGVEITDLAESVGISLGELADQNSLINDALESTINSLPDGIQGTLAPLLQAIETATDPAMREQLLADMVAFIDEQPEDIRNQLAPYFEEIDPITEAQQQVSELQSISATNQQVVQELQRLIADQAQDSNQLIAEIVSLTSDQAQTTAAIQQLIAVVQASGGN